MQESFWEGFKTYLQNERNIGVLKTRLSLAKKYYHILTDSNAQELLMLMGEKCLNAMKALSRCY